MTRGDAREKRAATASGVMLLIFAGNIRFDVGRRYIQGSEPLGPTMMIVSTIAGMVNHACPRLLQRLKEPDVDLRAATLLPSNEFLFRVAAS